MLVSLNDWMAGIHALLLMLVNQMTRQLVEAEQGQQFVPMGFGWLSDLLDLSRLRERERKK